MTDTKHTPTPYRMGSYSGVDPNNPGKTISAASVWLAGECVAFFKGNEASVMARGFEQGANSAHRRACNNIERVEAENAELRKRNDELVAALREAQAALNGAPNTVGLHNQIDAALAKAQEGER